MQFYGLQEERFVLASEAVRGQDYACPECSSAIRLREGPHRQAHFYHLRRPKRCRQHKKTLPHLQTQWKLQEWLPSGETRMERAFPEIGRIADVAWESKKMIFEVQCSPISREEVQERNRDYASLGWTTIWILHDRRFNKKNVTAAEDFLRKGSCYFTNIDESGKGIIYDQFDLCFRMHRQWLTPRLPISIQEPLVQLNSIYFRGDRTDRRLRMGPDDPLLKRLENITVAKPTKNSPWDYVKRFYTAIFRTALEKLCD